MKKNTKSKNNNKIKFSFIIVLFFFLTIFTILLKKINIIPNKYLIIILLLLVLINILCSIIILIKKKNKVIKIFKIITIVISLITMFGYIAGIFYMAKSLDFLSKITSIKEEISNYYIITLKEAKYEDISDLYLASTAYYENTDKKVIDSIKLDLNYKIITKEDNILKYLYDNEVEAIIISDIILNKIEDEDTEFEDKIKILKTIYIKNEIENITKKVSIKNTPFNVLISGIDTYDDINSRARNDVNMIATINPNTNQVLLTSIPRDYFVQLHGIEGLKDKLTHASYYGINTQVQTIEDLLDIDINYYIKVNFATVEDLVDAIGGIEVYSDKYLNLPGNGGRCIYIVGNNKLNGSCALRYARERKMYVGGDRRRVKNQQQVLQAIFKKMTSSSTLITDFSNILKVLEGKFTTSIDINEALDFIKYELDELKDYEFFTNQVDGDGSEEYTYSYPNKRLYVMNPFEDTVIEAHRQIEEMLNKKTK